MKKTICFLSLCIIASLTFVSCDLISGINLTDQSAIDKKLRAKIEKHIDPQSAVFEISLLTSADFSTETNIICIHFLAPGKEEVQEFNINVPGNQSPREVKVKSRMKDRTRESGIKLADIDFSQIASNINKGAAIMSEDEMKLDGIENYTLKFDGNPQNTRHSFYIRSKAGTEFGEKNGRAAMVTEYYEVQFTADAAGNVTAVE